MNNKPFHQQADEIYDALENWIDDSGIDLDYETSGSVFTITCENNGSKIILSRQEATQEIWVAALSGGFHFAIKENQWRCATGETLTELLSRVLSEQTEEAVSLELDLD